jgi:RHH-type proline utilization regulon transcriptional repressor/proline dehydrogenase/delta 1-pyrroline-5-carboxylate dehydrogenase
MNLAPFANEPWLELRRRSVRDELLAASASLEARLPLAVPALLGDDAIHGQALVSTDPGEPERVVALAPCCGAGDARRAVEVATEGAREWSSRAATDRAAALLRAAAWMRERRYHLAALCVRECAKPWLEADADVAEAIDYLEYYARAAIELERGAAVLQLPGEHNEMRYCPRGVCAVIAPWNFPIAIPTGMVSAALATGNAAVLKPAEQAPACAAMVVAALRAGGVPAPAISLLPGEGGPGAALVRDPHVHTIAFTGSVAVGLQIIAAAAEAREGQNHVKRVVAEMGGKNCVIVDSDADLDQAVPAIVHSAFAYAGQKCSAAARVLAHEAIAGALRERVAGAVTTLTLGQADAFGVDLGPLIDREARDRVLAYVRVAAASGAIVAQREAPATGGWFVPATVVDSLPPDCEVLREEVFGPLLALETVSTIEEALARIDSLPFALTGGLFSRNPHTVEQVAARSPVGNLYINRAITGAMVGRQPFGGNRLSGAGAKAGGPDYLLEFVEGRVVSENVLRHGLVL